MRFSLLLATASLALSSAILAACSASGTSTGFNPTEPGPTLGTPTDGTADGGGGGTTTDPKGCTPNPSCSRDLCECDDDRVMANDNVCLDDGSCNTALRCEKACGKAKFTGGAWEGKKCSADFECMTSEPNISCACRAGFGMNTSKRCVDGYCSAALKDVCPSACSSQGGWQCTGPADCTPVICECKNGEHPATAGTCSGGTCGPDSAVCPSACSAYGGWSGGGTTTPTDGGTTTGPKAPGEACNAGSECSPFDCGCNDGSNFKGIKSCQSKKCATKSQACSTACLSSGGWNGI